MTMTMTTVTTTTGIYDHDYDYGYYNNYYHNSHCFGGCPWHSHCRWGFCECNYGYTRRWGRCSRDWGRSSYRRPVGFNPLTKGCYQNRECLNIDFNLICDTKVTVQGAPGLCKCRQDMRWNPQSLQCEMYIDVDCSSFTYDTPVSPQIAKTVNETIAAVEKLGNGTLLVDESSLFNITSTDVSPCDADIGSGDTDIVNNETSVENNCTESTNMTIITDKAIISKDQAREILNETLTNSLLGNIDPKTASDNDIKEAFCRDIDSFAFEYRQEDPVYHRRPASIAEIIGGIVSFAVVCCLCCGCCCYCCKKKRDKRQWNEGVRGGSHSSHNGSMEMVHQDEMAGQPLNMAQPPYQPQPGYDQPPQPSYQPQPPYDPNNPYSAPQPIPTTQPGYTPLYPSLDGQQPPYPPAGQPS